MAETPKTITIDSIGKLVIPQNVQDNIDKLHKKVGAIEWSGALFYKITKGDFKKLKDLEFTALFVYPMDIGNHTYTEFNYDEKLLPAYDLCEEALEAHRGLIHTHSSMNAFFSHTDMTELTTNANKYNFYLSLIVNFDGKYVCKIAFPSKVKSNNDYTIKGPDGKPLGFKNNKEEDIIIISDLTIEKPTPIVEKGDWLDDLIVELKKPKKVELKKEYNQYNNYFRNNMSKFNFDNDYAVEKKINKKEITGEIFLSALLTDNGDISDLLFPKDEIESLLMEINAETTNLEFIAELIQDDFDNLVNDVYGGTHVYTYEKKRLFKDTIEELKKLEIEFQGYEDIYDFYMNLLNSKLNEL